DPVAVGALGAGAKLFGREGDVRHRFRFVFQRIRQGRVEIDVARLEAGRVGVGDVVGEDRVTKGRAGDGAHQRDLGRVKDAHRGFRPLIGGERRAFSPIGPFDAKTHSKSRHPVKCRVSLSIRTPVADSPEKRNWPEEELGSFLDRLGGGRDDESGRLIDRLPVIVYASELGETGRWRYVSPQVEEILGFTPEEFLCDPGLWARQVHPDDRLHALEVETRDRLGVRETAPIEYRMYTKSGRLVWMLDEAVLEPDESGVPVWHGVLYDISERKSIEIDLQRSLDQQAVVARLGERALKNGDPEALMLDAVTLIGELDGVEAACIWEVGRDGRRLNLCAGLEESRRSSGRRVSAGRESHAG